MLSARTKEVMAHLSQSNYCDTVGNNTRLLSSSCLSSSRYFQSVAMEREITQTDSLALLSSSFWQLTGGDFWMAATLFCLMALLGTLMALLWRSAAAPQYAWIALHQSCFSWGLFLFLFKMCFPITSPMEMTIAAAYRNTANNRIQMTIFKANSMHLSELQGSSSLCVEKNLM